MASSTQLSVRSLASPLGAIQLRLNTAILEMISHAGADGTQVVIGDDGVIAGLKIGNVSVLLDGSAEADPSKLVVCQRGRGAEEEWVATANVLQRATVVAGETHGPSRSAAAMSASTTAGAEGTGTRKLRLVEDSAMPSEVNARPAKRQRRQAPPHQEAAVPDTRAPPITGDEKGRRRQRPKDGTPSRGIGPSNHWISVTFNSTDVSVRTVESFLSGVRVTSGQNSVLWLPNEAAVKGLSCTCIIRLDRPGDVDVALMRSGETVELPKGRGYTTVTVERCQEDTLEMSASFGLPLRAPDVEGNPASPTHAPQPNGAPPQQPAKTVQSMVDTIRSVLPGVVFEKVQKAWVQLPQLAAGLKVPPDKAHRFLTAIEKALYTPIDHAALMLAATSKHAPTTHSTLPHGRGGAPLLAMSHGGGRALPAQQAELALTALRVTRKGLALAKHRIRSTVLSKAGDLRDFARAVSDGQPAGTDAPTKK